MKYELKILEKNFDMLKRACDEQIDCDNWQEDLHEEKDRIVQNLVRVVLTSTEEDYALIKYLRIHKYACEHLSDKLKEVADSFQKSVVKQSIAVFFQHCIDDLVSLITTQIEELENRNKEVENRDKLTITLSVPELGLFARLLYDEGIFKRATKKDLARFICRHMQVANKRSNESLSGDHLYLSFYKVNEGTIDSIAKLLQNLMKGLDKLRNADL